MDQETHKIVTELKTKISNKYLLHEIKVFGSSARGDRRTDSDIDVFIHLYSVDRRIEEDLFDMAYDLELKHDCLIDIIVFDDVALKGTFARSQIYHEVLSEGMAV
jgi:predicted nucleotidyltransferase